MEKKNPKISVIVPVYNVEQYLCRCIDSILAQSFPDFELLLIDDGSKDRSGEICDEYAQKNERVRVFHKENGGVSSARNLGLDNAKGEWISFVDADDWVEEDYLSNMILSIRDDIDIIVGGFFPSGNEFPTKIMEDKRYSHLDMNFFLSKYLGDMEIGTPWAILFRSKVIVCNKLRFDEKIHFNEDSLFNQNFLFLMKGDLKTIPNNNYNWTTCSDFGNKYGIGINEYVYTWNKLYGAYGKLRRKYKFNNYQYIKSVFCAHTIRLILGGNKLRISLKNYENFKEEVKKMQDVSCLRYDVSSIKILFVLYLIKKRNYKLLYVFLKLLCLIS